MLGILFPPSIFLLEFKTRQERLAMPVTLEEHKQDLAEEQAGENENQQENEGYRASRALHDESNGIELRYQRCCSHIRSFQSENGWTLETSSLIFLLVGSLGCNEHFALRLLA